MAAKGSGGGSKMVPIAAALIAMSLARKVVTFGWKRVTGNEPPTDPHDPDIALKEALGWAIVMGITMEAARLLAIRAATVGMRRAQAADARK